MNKYLKAFILFFIILTILFVSRKLDNTIINQTKDKEEIVDGQKTINSENNENIEINDVNSENNKDKKIEVEKDKFIEIQYSSENGYSMFKSEIIIKDDYEVIQTSQSYRMKEISENKTQLKYEDLSALFNLIDNNIFKFNNKYNCERFCPTDLNTNTITINLNGKVKSISMYAPENLPTKLSDILKEIKNIQDEINEKK